MNRIMTSLTLLAGLGLAGLAPQAQASDRHHGHGLHKYAQYYDHRQQRAYRKGYRDGQCNSRKYLRAKRHHYQSPQHYQPRRHSRHGYSDHGVHGRVIFKF